MTELLVLVVLILVLAVVTLPRWFGNREHVLRAKCLNNLRQVGASLSMYAADANEFVPVCGWPQNQSPWQTYSAARVMPGTSVLTRGYMSLGLLFRTKAAPDPSVFYCRGLERSGNLWGYDYYRTPPDAWPSTPAGSGDQQVRTSYNYYPQLRATSVVGGQTVSRLTYSTYTLEVGGNFSLVPPAKLTELHPGKSIATDVVHDTWLAAHQSSGKISGVNALFPDGSATYQSAARNPDAFDPLLWSGVGNNPLNFRILMNRWQP